MTESIPLKLNGFTFQELFSAQGLLQLDTTFLNELSAFDLSLAEQLKQYRKDPSVFTKLEVSELLITAAKFLEKFLANLFDIQEALLVSKIKTIEHNPLSIFKKYYILRRAKKQLTRAHELPDFVLLTEWLYAELKMQPLHTDDLELAIALLGNSYLDDTIKNEEKINQLTAWCTKALFDKSALIKNFSSFHIPERLDYENLVPLTKKSDDPLERQKAPAARLRLRDGFKLTDPRMDARHVQDQVNYCIYCHDHEGDFCSKGFPVKKNAPQLGFKKNPLDVILTGCPLEEKISEMHLLKKDGHTIAALAMVMIDNPMCPATGHRICNDCMKACIYQKQEPVNIPQIETRVLTDVLDLPWGVEIYDLLTRFNPLRSTQWLMKPYNGLKVMIAGMGPAGFTLAHHLLLEGFAVVGFDGLKIEPLSLTLINEPIYSFHDLKESLDERLMAGFGGVAEYGITVRWDKNFLKLIYLTLMRRPYFQVFGGVRFGGTITIQDAWAMGFDHFVVAVGAGLPKALPIPNSLAPGMRQANDFLMALQLGNAAKKSSLNSLQIRLPAVVIGGGLTGVDTATELQAYYVTLVEKISYRYEILMNTYGKSYVHDHLDNASEEILNEYLHHYELIKKERALARSENREPNFIPLVHKWGGVTILYRRALTESPAYINNHEELIKALEEGIYYVEGLEPHAVIRNQYGHCETLVGKRRVKNADNEWMTLDEEVAFPARSILVATGTQPNTAYEFEHHGTFNRSNLQYQHYETNEQELIAAEGVEHCKEPNFGPFTSYHHEDYRVSLIGDTHPVFHGSVVKAIASALRSYPKIVTTLKNKIGIGDDQEYQCFAENMRTQFNSTVTDICQLTDKVLQLTIKAPLAAKHFKPGNFYRLQNFETYAKKINHTLLQMEPLALIPEACNKKNSTLTFLVYENTAPQQLCRLLEKNEPVSLMGPTGVRAKIPELPETILVVGDNRAFSFVKSYGNALSAHHKLIYFCFIKSAADLYTQNELEKATHKIVYLTPNPKQIKLTRKEDQVIAGDDLVKSLIKHPTLLQLKEVDRIYVIANTQALKNFNLARKNELKLLLNKSPKVFGAVYGNMQCMLKGVCAQCLQWQIDPETGLRTKAVFACSWQDQPLELIDIDHINDRAEQNHLLDMLNKKWVEHLLNSSSASPPK